MKNTYDKQKTDSDESVLCGKRDLNPYGVNHTPLKRARLPVPPLSHGNGIIILGGGGNVKPFLKSFLGNLADAQKPSGKRTASRGILAQSNSGISSRNVTDCGVGKRPSAAASAPITGSGVR